MAYHRHLPLSRGLTWLVFGQTLWHDFINYDDPHYVYENTKITGGLSISGIAWAFTHIHSLNWHPLTTISHMLDCQLYGLKAGWHHFTNVLLHTLAAMLLFLALQQMTGAVWRSAFVAAVFAIHPLRVESVAWVAERKDVLSGVFFMLTLLAYVNYVRVPRVRGYLVVVFLFACGLMSKPMLVTLPFVLLLLDYWPLDRIKGQLWKRVGEKIPLIALSAVSSVITFLVQKGAVGQTEELPILERINNAVVSYVLYIWQMLWPVNARSVLPASGEPATALGNRLLSPPSNMHHGGSHRSAKTATVPAYGLVVVSGNACPGDRIGASRMAGPG